MKCIYCGYEGADVHEYRSHVGGKGDVFRAECDHMAECARRQDAAMFEREKEEVAV